MKAVLVHYHLKPGGVSTVIRRQLDACARAGIEAYLLVGEAPVEAPGVPFSVVPGLAYDEPGRDESVENLLSRGKALAGAMEAAVRDLAGGPPDLYHVHNPTIRKAAALCPALSELASRGAHVLLQAHDFAEDWRPDVLLKGLPYPAGCRWAVLNGRDLRALRAAGLPDASLDLLPNSLPPLASEGPRDASGGGGEGASSDSPPKADLVLYPVRGIRRKNLGELLLLSLWLPSGVSAAVTLPPNNPRDLPLYEAWKSLARGAGMPVAFEAGGESSLESLYARTACVVTTSVKEGFGFSFLEPLARRVPVVGRRIASVIPDFEAQGLRYPGLYSAIRVPRGIFDASAFERRLRTQLDSTASALAAALGKKPDWLDARMDEVFSAALPEGGADFGVLDEAAQSEVLLRLSQDPGAPGDFEAANPFLSAWWRVPPLEESDRAALESYSPANAAWRLRGVYERATAGSVGGAPDRDALARALLTPEGFFCPGA